ncbi:asparaginase [Hydrogenophaga sp.]|uniref:asparaginase n=1 Tax=Hydrogenophaga sp. TaxID=1904254 RepID=UPI0025B87FF8|nr:asparaginase [Hydrogenophaga sp.]
MFPANKIADDRSVTVVLGTGGTIAGRSARADDHVGYVSGEIALADLVANVPGLQGLQLEVEQVAQIDSKDMDLRVWQALVQRLVHHLARPEVGSVVITHGTDTLEETAFLLHSLLPSDKPVVLTCAMRPASALMADGPQNLLDAVTLARHPGAKGAMAVCAGQAFAALDVCKVHSYRLDAFDGGEAGALALIENGQVRQLHPWPVMHAPNHDAGHDLRQRFLSAAALPSVTLLTSHADADGLIVQALLASAGDRSMQGLVVAGTGNGTVHRTLAAALAAAQEQGVRVVRTTRCARGQVLAQSGHALPEISALSPVKARLALAMELLSA